MQARVFAATGEETGTTALPENVFGGPVREHLLHDVIIGYLANQRHGTAKVKTRGEVSGGGRKPWRQKGTGRARSGTIRSPLWVGGGRAFGPKPRSYTMNLNKKMRRLALRSALAARAGEEQICVMDEFRLAEPRTKFASEFLKRMGMQGRKCLIVLENHDEEALRATRNIPNVFVTTWQWLNAYDVLNCESLLFTKGALDKLTEASQQ